MSQSTPIFVVLGTDTAVGKTRVATGLARALSDLVAPVIAVKPVETGCGARPGPLEDGVALARATGQDGPRMALCRLGPRLVPPLAAARQRGRLSWDAIVSLTREAIAPAAVGLIEGTGGVMTPLTWEHTMLDLARAIGARVILVAPDRRGTPAQVRLALTAVRAAGLEVAAVVLNEPSPPPAPPPSVAPSGVVLHGVAPPKPARTPKVKDPTRGTHAEALARMPDVPEVTTLIHVASLGIAARVLEPLARRLLGG